jgi:hypothetical protein
VNSSCCRPTQAAAAELLACRREVLEALYCGGPTSSRAPRFRPFVQYYSHQGLDMQMFLPARNAIFSALLSCGIAVSKFYVFCISGMSRPLLPPSTIRCRCRSILSLQRTCVHFSDSMLWQMHECRARTPLRLKMCPHKCIVATFDSALRVFVLSRSSTADVALQLPSPLQSNSPLYCFSTRPSPRSIPFCDAALK